MTSSTGTPSRRPSSSARSGVMPFGWPVTASVCASTELPRLIAARSFPVGVRSFSTSGDTAPPALWAKAETVAARSMEAAERSIGMAFLPSAGPIAAIGCRPRRALRTGNAIRLLYASRGQRTARHRIGGVDDPGHLTRQCLFMARNCRSWLGRACPLCPSNSDINLFCYGQGIIDLDAEVSDGAFDLGVSEQKLHGSQVAGALVDQRCLCSSEGVGAKEMWLQPDAGNPLGDKACVLPRRHAPSRATPNGEQKFAGL